MNKSLIIEVFDINFKNILFKFKNNLLLAYFFANWCGPCKLISLILEELYIEYTNNVKIIKINIENNQNMTGQYFIRGIPSILFFQKCNLIYSKIGSTTKTELKFIIDKYCK